MDPPQGKVPQGWVVCDGVTLSATSGELFVHSVTFERKIFRNEERRWRKILLRASLAYPKTAIIVPVHWQMLSTLFPTTSGLCVHPDCLPTDERCLILQPIK